MNEPWWKSASQVNSFGESVDQCSSLALTLATEWVELSRAQPGRKVVLFMLITSAIPVIAVSDSARAGHYYCQVLGFQKMFEYRPDSSRIDPCYLGVARDGVWLHLDSFKRDRAGTTSVFLWVSDVDLLHQEIAGRGAVIQLPPTNQTWGTREAHIRDPDGNLLCLAMKGGAIA